MKWVKCWTSAVVVGTYAVVMLNYCQMSTLPPLQKIVYLLYFVFGCFIFQHYSESCKYAVTSRLFANRIITVWKSVCILP